MARTAHEEISVAIIGGGPASLILSYILHGHIPHYAGKHRDALLDSKLQQLKDLLQIHPRVYSHFSSSLRYSQQAQPINALLDTLVRPNADTEIDPPSHIEWRYEPERAVDHVILTDSSRAGGQWTNVSKSKSDEIGALSYAEMLSLPGYSFKEHYRKQFGIYPEDLMRPSRTLVASYYAAYPVAVGIAASIRPHVKVSRIQRQTDGFLIEPVHIKCKQLVLATGIFTHQINPPPQVSPLQSISDTSLPLLVIGSGFSAADTIIATPPDRKIVHLFKWNPADHPSPLRGCHHQAYPEYAGVYRQMKAAASQLSQAVSPLMRRKTNPFFKQRDWSSVYEGLPNATIESVELTARGAAVVIKLKNGTTVQRDVGGLAYHVGRRGSLAYLEPSLLREVLQTSTSPSDAVVANGEESNSNYLQRGGTRNGGARVANNVYAIGSLTGDSLVRHAFGVCIDAASIIMAAERGEDLVDTKNTGSSRVSDENLSNGWSVECGAKAPMLGDDGQQPPHEATAAHVISTNGIGNGNGLAHDDLHINRRDFGQR